VRGIGLQKINRHSSAGEATNNVTAEVVIPDSAGHHSASAAGLQQLVSMTSHIQRRSAKLAAAGQHVPETFPEADDGHWLEHFMPARFALVVKIDFLWQNSSLLQHAQLRKPLGGKTFGC
jgi:hypothetical protein